MNVWRLHVFSSLPLEHDLSLTSITPDLRWNFPWNLVWRCKINFRKGTENLTALRTAIFTLFKENHRGGQTALPPSGRGLRLVNYHFGTHAGTTMSHKMSHSAWGALMGTYILLGWSDNAHRNILMPFFSRTGRDLQKRLYRISIKSLFTRQKNIAI